MADVIQQDYLNRREHNQNSKRIIADYINDGFIRAGWLAKKIKDLKLPGVRGVTYRVKSDYSIGTKVRLDRLEWRKLPDFIGLSIIAPKSTFEYVPEALKNIRDLDSVSPSCFTYTLNCQFMDYPTEIALCDYKTFARHQFNECVRNVLGIDSVYSLLVSYKPLKEAFDTLLNTADENGLDSLMENNKYVKAFAKFLSLGCIRKGFGRFSIAFPSEGTEKPVSVNFEDGFECDSAFLLAFLTNPDYARLLRFGILSEDEDLHDLAFMAYKGVLNGTRMKHIVNMFTRH